ncbi:interleukin-2 receptor subunit beta isoform X2 [Puntigrus tetrazona]|uniref:interleukin-2 receptor subunit beta isoform X2 n=1 Tax=Puntigrus tetrazona TaxID=1606681 RepID=UPI001C8A426E|nr:interleukin-2 receptor subunit beta isoform X2 [Puntigrus tetrazona]
MQILALMMMMMMMMMTSSQSALKDQSLSCHNDYYNNITCVWDTSKLDVIPPNKPETCRIRVTVKKARTTEQAEMEMFADPAQPHILSATAVFNNRRGKITGGSRLEEEVWCDNYINPVAKTAPHQAEDSAVKAAPPQRVEVHGINVSWSFVPLRSFLKPLFGVQYRSAAQSWKDVERFIINADEPEVKLAEDLLLLNQQYVLRVRVKYLDFISAVWSDWSEEFSWTSTVGQTPHTPGIVQLESSVTGITLTGVTLSILLIFTILIKCKKIKRVQKSASLYIPDPSKFFGDLQSSHGGNFTSWLGPVLSHVSYKVEAEFISPVEVLKLKDGRESRGQHRNSGDPQDGWDSTTKSSDFSNSTYFMSQSSKGPSDALEPCSAHSSYGPAGGVSEATRAAGEKDAEELELCLEKLRQDTQSPDSGFAGGAEDSMEETELPSPLNLAPLPARDLLAPQPSRHPLTDLLLRPSCPIPALDLDLLNLDLKSCCGLIEPSSGDYMPVKNVQS